MSCYKLYSCKSNATKNFIPFLTHHLKTMEQHEIAIRDEVAEELGVIMGDMASEIKVKRALL